MIVGDRGSFFAPRICCAEPPIHCRHDEHVVKVKVRADCRDLSAMVVLRTSAAGAGVGPHPESGLLTLNVNFVIVEHLFCPASNVPLRAKNL